MRYLRTKNIIRLDVEEIFIFKKNLLTKLSFLIINFQVIGRHVITNSSEFAASNGSAEQNTNLSKLVIKLLFSF